MIDVPHTSVTREFTHITASLGLSLKLIDPSVYMPILQEHLSSSLTHHSLPSSLSKPLGTLSLRSVNESAVSLSRLLARLSPGHDVLRLPVPPTACAIFILALEGDLRAPLNPLGNIANCLGARLQVAKSVVMTRYKTIQDEIASWVENLPWLDQYESRGGRAKVSKRSVVARGLNDVIRFQEDIWRRRSKPAFPSELLAESNDSEHIQETKTAPPRPKKGSKSDRAMAQSIQFLLNPLGTPVPDLSPLSSRGPFPISQLSLPTYLLTSPSASVSDRLPTRLQLLACLRGGSSEDKIRDDELFAEGELENLIRDENEVHVLRETFGWDEDEELHGPETGSNRKRKRKPRDIEDLEAGIATGSAFRPQKTRLNIEALAQFMSGDHDAADDSGQLMGLEGAIDEADLENMEQNSDEEEGPKEADETIHILSKHRRCSTFQFAINTVGQTSAEDAGEVVLEWRPPSPGSGVLHNDSRYEEEYD
jgi:transcription factor IIIB subunit 2